MLKICIGVAVIVVIGVLLMPKPDMTGRRPQAQIPAQTQTQTLAQTQADAATSASSPQMAEANAEPQTGRLSRSADLPSFSRVDPANTPSPQPDTGPGAEQREQARQAVLAAFAARAQSPCDPALKRAAMDSLTDYLRAGFADERTSEDLHRLHWSTAEDYEVGALMQRPPIDGSLTDEDFARAVLRVTPQGSVIAFGMSLAHLVKPPRHPPRPSICDSRTAVAG